jgi:enolase-phosphatase E1
VLGSPIHPATKHGEVARVTLFNEAQIRVILLDIEGTTTPVDFVYKTLFPFASRKLESFLREHAREPEIRTLVEELRSQQEIDAKSGLQPPSWGNDSEEERLCSCVAYGQWLIAKDSKYTPLKSLEGKIWQQGYASGELQGEVYPDVPVAFERWKRQKKIVCIYSSGSTLAQQLLFRTTRCGDMTPHISNYFDTRVGAKTEAESYRRIADSMAHSPEQFLFISDAVKEVEAARSAGMQTLRCAREERAGGQPVSVGEIDDFTAVLSD